MKADVRAIVVLCLFLTTTAWSQQTSKAYILSVKGKSALHSRVLQQGHVLFEGDSVEVEPNASIRLLSVNGEILEYHTSFKLYTTYSNQPTEKAFLSQGIFNQCQIVQDWLVSAKEKLQATQRSAASDAVILNFPRNSKLLAPPEKLSWKSSLPNGFDLSIRCFDNDFSEWYSTKATEWKLNTSVLEKGKSYHWFVKKTGDEVSDISPAAWFSIMPDQERAQFNHEKKLLQDILQNDTTGTAYQLLYVNLLMQHDLNETGKMVLENVLAQGYNATAYAFYAAVCDRMELKQEAYTAYELTQTSGY